MPPNEVNRREYLKLASVGIGAASLAGLSGCMGGNGDDSEGLTSISKIQTEGSMTIPTAMAGIDQGIFEEEGIDLNYEVAGYGRYAQAITSDDSPFNPLNFAIYMNSYRDDDTVMLACGESKLINGIFVPEDSDIESPGDFEGRTIGIPPRDSGTTMLLTSMIQEEYEYDLEEIAGDIVEAEPPALYNLMVEQEDIDAMMQFGNQTVQGRAEGSPIREIFDPDEWWVDRTGLSAQISYWGTTEEWITENAETGLSVLRAWDGAREYTLDNVEEVVDNYGDTAGFSEPSEKEQVIEEIEDGAIMSPTEWDEEYVENQLEMVELLVDNGFYDSLPSMEEGALTFSQLEDMAADG